MRKTTLLHTIILLMALPMLSMSAPRLTVVVAVDGLTADNLTMLRPYLSQGGLRTLSEEAYQTSLSFPHEVYGGDETTATLMTGTTPIEHGYTMDTYFSRQTRKSVRLLEDNDERGIGCAERLSARALLATTLTDELRMRYAKAKIYAIGIRPEATLLLAGHGANSCCWLDSKEPKWVSTSYYSEGLPDAADDFNRSLRIQELLARMWVPRLDMPMYSCPTEQERKKSFSYDPNKVLKQSPVANTLVIELALAMQKREHMGEDTTPDMLLLHLNTLSPQAGSDAIRMAEQEDMYLSLNQDLGYLMEQLSKRIGKQNLQVLVVGLPRKGISKEQLKQANLPTKYFNVDQAAALTATYLMALYGHERWIDGGYGRSIYLNRTLIEQKRLSLETIERQVANFLMEFEGIQMAFPAHEALSMPSLQHSLNKRTMGDVVFTLEPGWILMENDKRQQDYVLQSDPQVPLLLWSGSPQQWPQGRLDATDIKGLINH